MKNQLTPSPLSQVVSNTCFLNAAVQACRKPIEIILKDCFGSVRGNFCPLLNLFLKATTGNKQYMSKFIKFVSTNKYFSSVQLGNMDDSFGFVRNIFECIVNSEPKLEQYVKGIIIPS